jgi:LPS-assembly protein
MSASSSNFNRARPRFLTCAGAIATGFLAAPFAYSQCPAPVEFSRPTDDFASATDEAIEIEADSLDAVKDGLVEMHGEVTIRQGVREVRTRDATYDTQSGDFSAAHPVQYSDPSLIVRGDSARVNMGGGALFEGAEFELPATNARGAARRIRADALGELELDDVRYTTCPLGSEDWVIKASDIDLSQRSGFGTARNARLQFKGVPILYTPFFSFPISNERKTGFLMPMPASSGRSGASLSTPWYWNIAPNYDATFVPTWYAKRGGRLDSEFRFLTRSSEGAVRAEVLPEDKLLGTDRSLLRFIDRSDFTDRLRLDIDASNVSDSRWFEDFGLGPEGTSITFLDRIASLTYLDDHWRGTLRAQNFQVIDDSIDPTLRPYTLLPQLALRGEWPEQAYGLTFGVDLEVGNFQHNFDRAPYQLATGWRLDVAPEVRMPLRGSGIFLEPAARFRYTGYKLDERAGDDDYLTRSAPIFSVDGGMIFERLWGAKQDRLQTLEPRFKYLYVPYRDQDELPNFDTGLADLNVVQLFRDNRYVGADRLGDANQLSIGVTSRFLDANTGEEFLAATIGQAYYFETPRVRLPNEVADEHRSSDIIAELDLRAYGNWTIGMGVQWDPHQTRSEKGDVHLQYRPSFNRVANLGYRFRRGKIEQLDGSVAWPLSDNWSAYGRMVYSLEDKQELDQIAGFEYRSCCWAVRLVARRYVSDRTGDVDTSVQLQLELKGLTSVGDDADAFLERAIRGYSRRPEER